MKNKFVADGAWRFSSAKSNLLTIEEIKRKYAAELAQAVPGQQPNISHEMANEISRRERTKSHKPSAQSLW